MIVTVSNLFNKCNPLNYNIKGLATVFSLSSLTCEFQMFYILLSVGGLISSINTPELIEKLRPFAYLPSAGGGMSGVRKNGCIKV